MRPWSTLVSLGFFSSSVASAQILPPQLVLSAFAPPSGAPTIASTGSPSSQAGTVQALVLPPALGTPFAIELELDGMPRTIVLTPRSVRGASFQLLVQGPGGALHEVAAPAERTYRGELIDAPGSVVTASLLPSGLVAVIIDPALEMAWEIVPLGRSDALGALHDVRPAWLSDVSFFQCGVDGEVQVDDQAPWTAAADSELKICEIAIDCDVDYYEKNGSSVGATLAAAEDRINGIQELYATVDRTFELGTIIVRTDAE